LEQSTASASGLNPESSIDTSSALMLVTTYKTAQCHNPEYTIDYVFYLYIKKHDYKSRTILEISLVLENLIKIWFHSDCDESRLSQMLSLIQRIIYNKSV
jgi:hypothetical protein